MRILVNDTAASTGGALSILQEFYSAVLKEDKLNEWIFLVSDNYVVEKDNVKVKIIEKKTWFNRMYFDLLGWKTLIRELKPDCIISLQNTIYSFCKIPQIVYVHQALPFQKEKRFSFLKKEERHYATYQYLIGSRIKKSIKKAKLVIVQSEWMKKEIEKIKEKEKIFKISPTVICNDINAQLIEWDNTKFIYPTSNALYKNNSFLYSVCEELNKKNMKYSLELTLPEEQQYKIKNVCFIGKIERSKLLEKYYNATLVFPSYIETFGLPLLEARMSNTVILAADTSFAREILDGYRNAYFFDAFKKEELVELMEKVIHGDIKKIDQEYTKIKEGDSWKEFITLVIENTEV